MFMSVNNKNMFEENCAISIYIIQKANPENVISLISLPHQTSLSVATDCNR